MERLVTTLCFVHREDEILLGYKKRGFGAGTWNGFGGKVEQGESIVAAAVRELKEEACLDALAMEKRAILDFSFKDGTPAIEMHVFEVTDFAGTPTETDEMAPKWYAVSEIPYDNMWIDDQFWLPLYLKRQLLRASFHFLDQKTLCHHEICEASEAELIHDYAIV